MPPISLKHSKSFSTVAQNIVAPDFVIPIRIVTNCPSSLVVSYSLFSHLGAYTSIEWLLHHQSILVAVEIIKTCWLVSDILNKENTVFFVHFRNQYSTQIRLQTQSLIGLCISETRKLLHQNFWMIWINRWHQV